MMASSDKILLESRQFLNMLLQNLKVDKAADLPHATLMNYKVEGLVKFLTCGARSVEGLLDYIQNQESRNQKFSDDLIASQTQVISLQQQLLEAKDVQLAKVTTAVEEKVCKVTEEVKAEISSYSDALQSRGMPAEQTVSSTDMKTAVRTALSEKADEEERETNIVIFGLEEKSGEKLGERVNELLGKLELGEKPRFTARRVGEVRQGATKRPVKVSLRSSLIARRILAKSPKLRGVENYNEVYVSPDRTPEQRTIQRELVSELKRRRIEEPLKRHFIRGVRVESLDGQ